jgi:hypothetical protein
MPTEVKTGVGRIVWGNPLKARQKTDDNNKPVMKDDGTPVIQHGMGVAFPKAEFQRDIWPAMAAEAATAFPQGVPPLFSWKFVDGDTIDAKGKPYAEREGYRGCIVLAITSNTGFPPSVYKFNAQRNNYDPVGPEGLKTGDYVACALSFQVNVPTNRTHKPGLYVNPQAIELVGYGTEIVSAGVDPMQAFGGRQYQLPPGASATPIAPQHSVGMPGMTSGTPQQPPQMPGYAPQQPPMQQPPQMPGYAPQQPAQMPYQPPMQQPPQMPGYAPQQPPAPGGYPMPGALPPPAHDFTHQAGYAPQQPAQMPGYAPQQPPAPGGYPIPGQMPPR